MSAEKETIEAPEELKHLMMAMTVQRGDPTVLDIKFPDGKRAQVLLSAGLTDEHLVAIAIGMKIAHDKLTQAVAKEAGDKPVMVENPDLDTVH